MTISLLRLNDFRNLAHAELAPAHHGLNILFGNNGSGKTSLLEAIHYLSTGKSFKTATATRLIKYASPKFSIFAHFEQTDTRQIPIGVERETTGAARIRVAEEDVSSQVLLATLLPLRMINAQSHQLFESGPTFRRKYLDWGLFYAEESFFPCWRHYERALKQRNAVLRAGRTRGELDVWTEEMVKHGLLLNQQREQYTQSLGQALVHTVRALLQTDDIQLHYKQGWDQNKTLHQVLTHSTAMDFGVGYTQYGPHRADLEITMNGLSVKHFLSRGQQKLLICAMIIAQGKLLAQHTNKGMIYLIDDLPSELDTQNRQELMSLLATQQTQIFITAIESETICDAINTPRCVPMKLFHVEHGQVAEKRME
ncbi:MAG: DNA replication/repair protein RecF [Gammaproteobacteria bacterium]|nr:DNA replication/repair protein RecF [Gammaproteobacteria bacterium]